MKNLNPDQRVVDAIREILGLDPLYAAKETHKTEEQRFGSVPTYGEEFGWSGNRRVAGKGR